MKGHPVTNAMVSCLPVSPKVNEAFKFANVKLVGNRLFQLVVNLLASHISLACLEASFLHKKVFFSVCGSKIINEAYFRWLGNVLAKFSSPTSKLLNENMLGLIISIRTCPEEVNFLVGQVKSSIIYGPIIRMKPDWIFRPVLQRV